MEAEKKKAIIKFDDEYKSKYDQPSFRELTPNERFTEALKEAGMDVKYEDVTPEDIEKFKLFCEEKFGVDSHEFRIEFYGSYMIHPVLILWFVVAC